MKKAGKPKTPRGQNGKNCLSASKNLDFVAVDVETANSNVSSICQVGIAMVRSAEIKEIWTQLVDPHDFFDPYNIAIHGIDQKMVSGYPRFEELCDKIARHLGEIVVSHTFFDRRAISKAFEECGKSLRYGTWIDSAQVARRAWPDKYALRGYNLENVARDLGIHFRHHDAGEDARVAAEIVLRAYADTTLGTNKQ
ncbi:MAG: exonuclease domain-containing protein [Candidatus Dadabacteria bacterium]|nr:exonuclease domain-containing protein [Candidatus Dadabacteria bacterium]MDE0477845.1 exonuclease domain-containing protein [Candidatus Dadabacteria bacterium]